MLGEAGVGTLRAVLPPHTDLFAVAGVDDSNFAGWLNSGITGIGIGSALYKPGDSAADVGRKAEAMVSAYDGALQDM